MQISVFRGTGSLTLSGDFFLLQNHGTAGLISGTIQRNFTLPQAASDVEFRVYYINKKRTKEKMFFVSVDYVIHLPVACVKSGKPKEERMASRRLRSEASGNFYHKRRHKRVP